MHPVCGYVICPQCQSPDKLHRSPPPPSTEGVCLYHRDEVNSERLSQWLRPHKPREFTPLAPLLPKYIQQGGVMVSIEQKISVPPGGIDVIADAATTSTLLEGTATEATPSSYPFLEMCGNCHKSESSPIVGIDIQCMISVCVHCFACPKGHEDHARDKVLRLMDSDVIINDLNKKLAAVLTEPVVKRVESAYVQRVAQAHQQRDNLAVEEGKITQSVPLEPITQSFLERTIQIWECGLALLTVSRELEIAYNEMLARAREKTTQPSSASSSSASSAAADRAPIPDNDKMVQFLENGGKDAVVGTLSRLEGMKTQRILIPYTCQQAIKLLGPPPTSLPNGDTASIDDKNKLTGAIQAAFQKSDITCPATASKAVMQVRTLMGIRGMLDGDDISLELDTDGLEALGLMEGVHELTLACQNVSKHLLNPNDKEFEAIKNNLIHSCRKVDDMLTVEAIYCAMEQAFARNGASRYFKQGWEYMFAAGGKPYDGAKAIAAFDLAILLGDANAKFRKAQLLFDGRHGVKKDTILALKLFEELRSQGLYLPEIYYYLSKHVLERSLGRPPYTYKLVSEYLAKIVEMRYDGNERVGDHEHKEGVLSNGGVIGQGQENMGNMYAMRMARERTKRAVLFAQAGVYFIYTLICPELVPYFRRQLPHSVRQWIKKVDFYNLCAEAVNAGCEEPELYCMLAYAYSLRIQEETTCEVIIRYLGRACDLGFAAAYHLLGRLHSPTYAYLKGCPKDSKKAMSYYVEAESRGYIDGGRLFTDIGSLYMRRKGEAKDGGKALAYFDRAIFYGDEAAWYWKTRLFTPSTSSCPPIAKAAATAFSVRREAEVAGCKHPSLFSDLAGTFIDGEIVKRDGMKALMYLEKSAEYGSPRMNQWIGNLYDTTQFVDLPNLKKCDFTAFQYYIKEAGMLTDEDGFDAGPVQPWLYERIGSMYEVGRGTSRDYDRAVEFYKKAGETCIYALTRLGAIYDTARTGILFPGKNDVEARKYYKSAIDGNTVEGWVYMYLGNMYRDGRGGDIDGLMAVKCYSKALSLRWADALYEKALIFDPERKECPPFAKDEDRAVELYLAADAAGGECRELMLALADCYRRGRCVVKDEIRARDFTRRAK